MSKTSWIALGIGVILLSIATTIISVVGMLTDFIEPSAMSTGHTDDLLQVSLALGFLGLFGITTFGTLRIAWASLQDSPTNRLHPPCAVPEGARSPKARGGHRLFRWLTAHPAPAVQSCRRISQS